MSTGTYSISVQVKHWVWCHQTHTVYLSSYYTYSERQKYWNSDTFCLCTLVLKLYDEEVKVPTGMIFVHLTLSQKNCHCPNTFRSHCTSNVIQRMWKCQLSQSVLTLCSYCVINQQATVVGRLVCIPQVGGTLTGADGLVVMAGAESVEWY